MDNNNKDSLIEELIKLLFGPDNLEENIKNYRESARKFIRKNKIGNISDINKFSGNKSDIRNAFEKEKGKQKEIGFEEDLYELYGSDVLEKMKQNDEYVKYIKENLFDKSKKGRLNFVKGDQTHKDFEKSRDKIALCLNSIMVNRSEYKEKENDLKTLEIVKKLIKKAEDMTDGSKEKSALKSEALKLIKDNSRIRAAIAGSKAPHLASTYLEIRSIEIAIQNIELEMADLQRDYEIIKGKYLSAVESAGFEKIVKNLKEAHEEIKYAQKEAEKLSGMQQQLKTARRKLGTHFITHKEIRSNPLEAIRSIIPNDPRKPIPNRSKRSLANSLNY